MTEEQKIKIARELTEILPHKDISRNQFGGVNRISDLPGEVIENLLKLIFRVEEDVRKEILQLIEFEEKHSPKCPEDITDQEKCGWYLGRIDGLQAIQNKI